MATAEKTPKTKTEKPVVPAATKIMEQMKRAALGKKLSSEELDNIAQLAGSLKVFLQ